MRNKLSYFLGYLVIGFFCNCSEPEDIYVSSKNLNVKNLIQIETATSYKVNDLLYINASFSRYLPEQGFSDLLDIYQSSKATEYLFSFSLEKKSAYGTWTQINLGDKILPIKGKSSSYYGNAAVCVLNPQNEKYEYRAGIPLLETGEFRLIVSNQINAVYSNNRYTLININTTIDQLDERGQYSFTVN